MSADELSLKCSKDIDSVTITLSEYDHAYSDSEYTMSTVNDDTITLSSGYNNGYTLGSNVSITGIGVPWSNTTGTSNSFTFDPNWGKSTSAKIQLDGPDADIEINGESLIDMLRNIEQRLNILRPNETLESEWAELKKLGDQYRTLEKHIQEKQATWNRLKAMSPPDID